MVDLIEDIARRNFLKQILVGGTATLVLPSEVEARQLLDYSKIPVPLLNINKSLKNTLFLELI